MSARGSRHAGLGEYVFELPNGAGATKIYEPRFSETTSRVSHPRQHTVRAGDRLDLLAEAYLQDPHKYWRIVDANPTSDPDELIQPQRVLVLPEID